jgi:hypothetical protein
LCIAQVAPHECFVHDGLGRRPRVVQRGEIPSGAQRDGHRAEVPWRHDVAERLVFGGIRAGAALEPEAARGEPVNVERNRGRDRGRFHARQGLESLQQAGGEHPRQAGIDLPPGEVVCGEQHAFAPKTGIRSAGIPEALEKQRRGHQHHRGDGHLGAHQRIA